MDSEAVGIARTALKEEHDKTLGAVGKLAQSRTLLGEYRETERLKCDSLQLKKGIFGVASPETIDTMETRLYFKLNRVSLLKRSFTFSMFSNASLWVLKFYFPEVRKRFKSQPKTHLPANTVEVNDWFVKAVLRAAYNTCHNQS